MEPGRQEESEAEERRVTVDRPSYPEEEGVPSILELVNVVLRRRKLFIVLPIVVAVLAVGHGLLTDRTFSSAASFMQQDRGEQGPRLGGLAAQFGVNLGGITGGQSPQFYADLLHSTDLLGEAVDTPYQNETDSRRASDLVQLYSIDAESAELRRNAAIERLRNHVKVTTIEATGVVEFTVTTPWPGVSHQVAERMIELIQQFNVERRQIQAKAERDFLEDRVESARQDLFAAEDSLEAFLESNRSYQNSPHLRFEYERLQRRVSLQQQVYTSLAQSYEDAKVQAVRNTPVLTVVEPPKRPVKPDSRFLAIRGILGLMLGGMVAAFWAFGSRTFLQAQQMEAEKYDEFQRLTSEVREELNDWSAPVRNILHSLGVGLGSYGDGDRG